MAEQGGLKIQCFVEDSYVPVDKVTATLTLAQGQGQVGESQPIDLTTNSSGESQII